MSGPEAFRRHQRQCPLGSPPPGLRRLDVFPDYGAFPVWECGMVGPESLALSDGLAERLRAWNDHWEDCADRGIGIGSEWDLEGLALARRLERETGAAVVYRWPAGPDGGDPRCTGKPSCGRSSREAVAILRRHGHDVSRFEPAELRVPAAE